MRCSSTSCSTSSTTLGYSALQTGLRLLLISGPTLVTATVAGRLSERVPVRWLIGPGLVLVGAGLLLMTGLSGTSSWTHLVPGFIISGAGAGFVNPPLASTAIGVVEPQRAGMASGVNTTFRQIGIAVSIAALGTIFSSSLRHDLDRLLAPVPQLKAHAQQIVNAVRQGQTGSAFGFAPTALRSATGSGGQVQLCQRDQRAFVHHRGAGVGRRNFLSAAHPEPGFRPPPARGGTRKDHPAAGARPGVMEQAQAL